jgi:dephospho-CoA kinase
MLKIGITGGIGSGKSLVAKMFALLGVPVFDADAAAKYLMEHDEALKIALQDAFGTGIFKNGRLDRPLLASLVFQDTEKLKMLNYLVHPVTIAFSRQWTERQQAPYVLKEAALFFESGSYMEMDKMIGVYAPEALRVKRVMDRDGVSAGEVRLRMARQMNEEDKMKKCDFVIYNDGSRSVIEQALELHQSFIATSSSPK